ncbi:hypothetical protein TIFTF001_006195 [Ficus carica]|uniref:Uncharacterized protein n=1 Tax=Ficus carica TaxID=3494 RepID=A0AA88A3M1_FICCA|nr:hypothetical protein TIFTF001_006195 [Ficus carica]
MRKPLVSLPPFLPPARLSNFPNLVSDRALTIRNDAVISTEGIGSGADGGGIQAPKPSFHQRRSRQSLKVNLLFGFRQNSMKELEGKPWKVTSFVCYFTSFLLFKSFSEIEFLNTRNIATCLSKIEQSPCSSFLESMRPFPDAVVKPELLKHQDGDVNLLVATCVIEITRVAAPKAPYSDNVLKDIFHSIVGTLGGLHSTSGPSCGRMVVILETLAKSRFCVVMLDLECHNLVNEMFTKFFNVARDDHSASVLLSIQTIMVLLIEESDEIQEDLLLIALSVLGCYKSDVNTAARRLAFNVIEQCAGKLEAGIKQFLISSMSRDRKSVKYEIDYHEVIYDVYRCAPLIIAGVAQYLTRKLMSDQLDTRLKAVGLVGDLFALPGSSISEAFQPVFSVFLKRLTDRVVTVRMFVLEHLKSCLMSNTFTAGAAQIVSALRDQLLDCDEKVRKQVVAVICDVACHDLSSIPVETVKLVAERLQDKSLFVKRYTLKRLAEIYGVYCLKCADGKTEFDWIPGKTLRCLYDRDFRPDTIESFVYRSMLPTDFSMIDKVQQWLKVFSGFDKVEMMAHEKILEQKRRLHRDMQTLSVSQADDQNCIASLSCSSSIMTDAEAPFADTFMSGVKIDYPNLD